MKKYKIAVALTSVLTLSVAGNVYAQGANVFKWVDEKGVIHYGDRPPPAQDPIKGAWVINKAMLGASDTLKPLTGDDVNGSGKKSTEDTKGLDAQQNEMKQKECSKAKEAVRTLAMGGRISFVNEKGEKEYLTDLQIQQKLEETKKLQDEWCNAVTSGSAKSK